MIKKRNMWIVMYAFVLSFMIVSMYDVKSYACEVAVVEESETAGDYIEPRSIIEWRYKLVDGVLYRRKYNYTEECWVGDWEVVPMVEA